MISDHIPKAPDAKLSDLLFGYVGNRDCSSDACNIPRSLLIRHTALRLNCSIVYSSFPGGMEAIKQHPARKDFAV